MKNIFMQSISYSESPQLLECLINGQKAQNIHKDVANIKCPICGDTMKLSQIEGKDDEYVDVPISHSRNCCSYEQRKVKEYNIGVICPNCHATLSLVVHKILRIGTRYDYINEK